MSGISPWAASAASQLTDISSPVYTREIQGYLFTVHQTTDSLWIVATWPSGVKTAFRLAYSPDNLVVKKSTETLSGLSLTAVSPIGRFAIDIAFPKVDNPLLNYTITFTPGHDLFVPFWPRDTVITSKNGQLDSTTGQIHVSQTGTRSGLIYASITRPESGSFLYFQNLSSLAEYNIDTQTSAGNTVGGQWPEIGFCLPAATQKPLKAGKAYIISDAWISLDTNVPADQFAVAKGFLDALAGIYLLLPKPETEYHDYPEVLKRALHDLQNGKGCWTYHNRHPYLSAYVCDYTTPPEIMVQLAVLLPVEDYMQWSGESCVVKEDIIGGLPPFYDEKLRTIMRWLPSQEDMLDKSEEQKVPKVMDSWYLHHPLLNLARMAKAGDKVCKKLLLKSVDYAIKVAHHFKYNWPVFYQMETLEVLKAETKEGEGGEKDVAGLYAHVMLQVWELTGEKKYLNEAEKAARSLVQHGFNLFYQANNTMFAAKAMILLYKETGKELYRDLSYVFLANIFKNVALWSCTYGYGANFPNFFALYPLNDAPYTAVYEEQEAFAAIHEFLMNAQGVEIMPSVSLLLAEFMRYMVHRAVYYYPSNLPKEMISEKVKTGEVDPGLWIALEDIHDGWEKSGEVGQEVYGAGLAFGIVPRQYTSIPGENFMVFVDYPVTGQHVKGKSLSLNILGDERLTCRMCIVKTGEGSLPNFKIVAENTADQQQLEGNKKKKDLHEFIMHGNQKINISWNK